MVRESQASRRGAALIMALLVVIVIVTTMVLFLETSLTYSGMAVEDRVRAKSLASADFGLAMAYQRLRSGLPLDNQVEAFKTDGGRDWGRGEVSGSLDHQDGSDSGEYYVEVFFSELEKISGRADAGSTDRLLEDDALKTIERPGEWFQGKKFMMLTGDLAGEELRINKYDKPAGTIAFDAQPYSILPGDLWEIPAGIEYQFLSRGSHIERSRTTETWWWRQSKPLKKYAQRGAIVANGKVKVLGNMEIDGRDHCANGGQGMPDSSNCPSPSQHHVLWGGVKGISSTGVTYQGGSSGIGGDGDAPTGSPSGLNYSEQYPAASDIDNGLDDDGDGSTDEDPYNGVDDDRNADGEIVKDGKKEEDLRFPRTPDEAMALDEGSLRLIAKQSRTYFSSQAAFESYLAANGGILPGGLVYFLEIPVLDMGRIEMDMNGSDDPADDPDDLKPIVFAVHYEDSDGNPIGEIKNLFLIAKGLVLADIVNKVNGGTRIIGGLQSFSDSDSAGIYGNGAAKIWYSSAVLANLPNNAAGAVWNFSTWRELP